MPNQVAPTIQELMGAFRPEQPPSPSAFLQPPASNPDQQTPSIDELLSQHQPGPLAGFHRWREDMLKDHPQIASFLGGVEGELIPLAKNAADLLGNSGLLGQNAGPAMAKAIDRRADEWKREVGNTKAANYPSTKAVGELAGNVLLYSAAAPAFFDFGPGAALVKAAPTLGRLVMAGTEGATLEGARSPTAKDVPSQMWKGALGAAFGEGLGMGAEAGMAKVANTYGIKHFLGHLQEIAKDWDATSMRIAENVRIKVNDIQGKYAKMVEAADKAKKGNAPKRAKILMDQANKFKAANEYFWSSDFVPYLRAGDETTAAPYSYQRANQVLIKKALGNDKVAAKRIYKMLSTSDRTLFRKGMIAQAIEQATGEDGHVNPRKLASTLTSEGSQIWFDPSEKMDKVIQGLTGLIASSKFMSKARHTGMFRVSEWAAGGALAGGASFEHSPMHALGGLLTYIGIVKLADKLMDSQGGRNFLAAAASVRPGTPKAAVLFNQAMRRVGAPAGALLAVPPQN